LSQGRYVDNGVAVMDGAPVTVEETDGEEVTVADCNEAVAALTGLVAIGGRGGTGDRLTVTSTSERTAM